MFLRSLRIGATPYPDAKPLRLLRARSPGTGEGGDWWSCARSVTVEGIPSVCQGVVHKYIYIDLCMYVYVRTHTQNTHTHTQYPFLLDIPTMWWLRSVGSIKLQVSFAEYRLFYMALLQKRPIILSILLTKAIAYQILINTALSKT